MLAIPAVGAAIIGLTINLSLYHRCAILPEGNAFFLAQLIADGSAKRYLSDACPAEHFALCPYVDTLASNRDELLWFPGPFQELGYRTPSRRREVKRIIRGTIRGHPLEVLRDSISHTMTLLRESTVDDLTPSRRDDYWIDLAIRHVYPQEIAAFRNSLQSAGTLNTIAPGVRTGIFATLSVAIVALRLGRRGREGPVGMLGALCLAGVIANAAITGTVSGPAPRYAVRIVWVLTLAAACCCFEPIATRSRRREPKPPRLQAES